MSLTSKQVDELRSYASTRKGELAKMINDAADTIEALSAKQEGIVDAIKAADINGWVKDDLLGAVEAMPSVQQKPLKYSGESICVFCRTPNCDGCLYEPMEGVE